MPPIQQPKIVPVPVKREESKVHESEDEIEEVVEQEIPEEEEEDNYADDFKDDEDDSPTQAEEKSPTISKPFQSKVTDSDEEDERDHKPLTKTSSSSSLPPLKANASKPEVKDALSSRYYDMLNEASSDEDDDNFDYLLTSHDKEKLKNKANSIIQSSPEKPLTKTDTKVDIKVEPTKTKTMVEDSFEETGEIEEELNESIEEEEEEDELEQSVKETKPTTSGRGAPRASSASPTVPNKNESKAADSEDEDDDDYNFKPSLPTKSSEEPFAKKGELKPLSNDRSNNLRQGFSANSLSGSLPDLKVPNRFSSSNLLAKDILGDVSDKSSGGNRYDSKMLDDEDEDAGPEINSEEEEEVFEEDYSQLDQDIQNDVQAMKQESKLDYKVDDSFDESENSTSKKASQIQSKIVASRYDELNKNNSSKANVTRLSTSTMRSTKGWDTKEDDRADQDFAFDEDEDETDQTDLYAGNNSVPGKEPSRNTTNSFRPNGQNLRLLDADNSNLSQSQSFSEGQENSFLQDSPAFAHGGSSFAANVAKQAAATKQKNDDILHTSYRSNQDEDDELVIDEDEDVEEETYDEDVYEEDVEEEQSENDDERASKGSPLPPAEPQKVFFTAGSSKSLTSTLESQKVEAKVTSEHEDEDEDNYDDDNYGDDFDNEEDNEEPVKPSSSTTAVDNKPSLFSTSAKAPIVQVSKKDEDEEDDANSVEEDIEEDIEEEDEAQGKDDMSVGGQVSFVISSKFHKLVTIHLLA